MKRFALIIVVLFSTFVASAQYQEWYSVNVSARKVEIGKHYYSDEAKELLTLCSNSNIKWAEKYWWRKVGDLNIIFVDTTGKASARTYHIIMDYEKNFLFGQRLVRIVCDMKSNTGERTIIEWTKEKFRFLEYFFSPTKNFDSMPFNQFCEKYYVYDSQKRTTVWFNEDQKKSQFFINLKIDLTLYGQYGLKFAIN